MEGTFVDPNLTVNGELHPDTRFPLIPLLVVVLGAFMAVLDSSIVNVVIPKLMAVFGVDANRIEWVSTGYLLGSGVVVPATGFLADRVGLKKMFVFSLVVFTSGSLLCGLAWSNGVLIAFRVLQALGGGMIMPLSLTIMYSMVPREKIGMALGLWGIAIAAAPAVGPTLGGYLADRFTWRLIFTINIPIGIVAVILVLLVLPAFPRRPNLKPDVAGFLLAAWGAFAFLYALAEGQDKGWTSLPIVVLLVTGTFAFILFALWELRHPEPLLDIRLLKNGVFTVSLLAVALSTIGLFAVIFLVPIFTETLLGYTPLQTGLLLLPMALTTGVLMPVSGRLFDKVGAFWPGFAGLVTASIVTYGMRNLGVLSSYHGIEITLVFWAVGLGLAVMPLTTAGMYTIPAALVSRASALNNLVRQIAASLGIAFLVYVMDSRQVFHYNWLAATLTYGSAPAAGAVYRLSSFPGGRSAALDVLSLVARRQSFALGIDDAFVTAALMLALAVPLVFFLTKGRVDAVRAREVAAYNNGRPR
ncbi:MAG: DHA2 family efflux MFS transporter permease subunit [Peptococcaceae bacterium]|nr:DHA2 family efflux MFS transporter permease subunit [Peptococcaceae bacterium]